MIQAVSTLFVEREGGPRTTIPIYTGDRIRVHGDGKSLSVYRVGRSDPAFTLEFGSYSIRPFSDSMRWLQTVA